MPDSIVLIAFLSLVGNLGCMRSEPFPSLTQLRKESIEKWGDTYPDEASAFLDACLNGEYHEEEASLQMLGDQLSEQELASLFLPVCHGLIAGSANHRDGEGLATVMRCYSALELWQRKRLDSTEQLLTALADVRNLVIESLAEQKSLWWYQIWESMRILEYGVRSRMGLSPLEIYTEYGNAEARLG